MDATLTLGKAMTVSRSISIQEIAEYETIKAVEVANALYDEAVASLHRVAKDIDRLALATGCMKFMISLGDAVAEVRCYLSF